MSQGEPRPSALPPSGRDPSGWSAAPRCPVVVRPASLSEAAHARGAGMAGSQLCGAGPGSRVAGRSGGRGPGRVCPADAWESDTSQRGPRCLLLARTGGACAHVRERGHRCAGTGGACAGWGSGVRMCGNQVWIPGVGASRGWGQRGQSRSAASGSGRLPPPSSQGEVTAASAQRVGAPGSPGPASSQGALGTWAQKEGRRE